MGPGSEKTKFQWNSIRDGPWRKTSDGKNEKGETARGKKAPSWDYQIKGAKPQFMSGSWGAHECFMSDPTEHSMDLRRHSMNLAWGVHLGAPKNPQESLWIQRTPPNHEWFVSGSWGVHEWVQQKALRLMDILDITRSKERSPNSWEIHEGIMSASWVIPQNTQWIC